VLLLVSVAAAAVASVSVGVAALQGSETEEAPATRSTARAGAPPLALDLGIRTDEEAARLRSATALLDRGRRAQAARLFARSRSLEARIGLAVARWPNGTVPSLRRLAREHPRSGAVRLNLGLGLFWQGREGAAAAAWRAATRVDPDSPAAVRADDLLHPQTPRGLPQFVPGFAAPARITSLPPAQQVAALARDAQGGSARAHLLYGVALQRLGRPVSAQRQFAAAVRSEPGDVEAQVADAVGRFRKSQPTPAFARLGPLSARHGSSPTVRFHFGLVLLWLGRVDDGRRQLLLARAAGPRTPLGREAAKFLRALPDA
jgi:tetratricopeptide (TPR) repeat protein